MTQNNVIQFSAHRNRNTAPANPPVVPKQESPAETSGASTPVSTAVASANVQSTDAQVFDLQNYVPKGKTLSFVESSQGSHHIPHRIFEFMFKAIDSRSDLAVFACLMRFTLGFHRTSCEASYTFIAEWTGLSVASVRRGLESLTAASLIRCLQPSSFRDSAIYEIPVVKAYLVSCQTAPIPTAQNKTIESQNHGVVPKQTTSINQPNSGDSERGAVCLQEAHPSARHSATSRQSGVPPEGTKKDNTNIQERNSLSQETLPENLTSYFQTLKPEQKKRAELNHFLKLQGDYSNQDLSKALAFLVEFGVPGSGQQCHSPMAYLSSAMEGVLAQVKARSEKINKRQSVDASRAEKQRLEDERDAEDARRSEENRRRFEQAFPTAAAQEECIRDFAKRFPFFSKNSYALRMAAIGEWASKQK